MNTGVPGLARVLTTPTTALAEGQEWVWVPFTVDKKFDGLRIDQFLAQRLIGYSRSQVQRMLEECRVLNGNRPVRPSARVRTADEIRVAYPRRPEAPLAPDASLPILFEDEDFIIVNKPANLLSHPTDKTVAHTVLGVLRHARPDVKPHLLHRLDRETSGVLVLGKNPSIARRWTSAMERHEMQKEYIAFVRGSFETREGVIDMPIGRQGGDIKVRQWVHAPGAVNAVTTYKVEHEGLSVDGSCGKIPFAVVRAMPKTGRLHQIRVHLSAIGHPLLGDPLYTDGGDAYRKMIKGAMTPEDRESLGFSRVALHAAAMTFTHPSTKQLQRIEAPLPGDMAECLRAIVRSV